MTITSMFLFALSIRFIMSFGVLAGDRTPAAGGGLPPRGLHAVGEVLHEGVR